jgi:hypothetical protein
MEHLEGSDVTVTIHTSLSGEHLKNAVFCDIMLCGFVTTDVSEEGIASIIWVTRIG